MAYTAEISPNGNVEHIVEHLVWHKNIHVIHGLLSRGSRGVRSKNLNFFLNQFFFEW